MTFTNKKNQKPKSLRISKHVEQVQLPVHGQGVVLFDASGACSLRFCDASGVCGLKVAFTDTSVLVTLQPSNEPLLDPKNAKGLVKQSGAYYWCSLDSQNQRLSAGIGEARIETGIYTYQFPHDSNWESRKCFFETLVSVSVENLQVRSLLRDPITRKVSLLVKDTEELTMDAIASGVHMPKANLSIIAQKLYDCISGKQFVLNTPDFPEFCQAIEHSLATPGKWCHERIKAKANEFNKEKPNVQETYLRITLGENNGESPGVPYVMEIWPVGHYSPIHNHGGSSAVVRVLNGSIQVGLFPFLSGDELEPFASATFKKNDITWISPGLNQVHQLKNLDSNKDTCITIQCYMYRQDNTAHYDYFDYINDGNKIEQYEPDSDMDFIDFKKTMKREWMEYQEHLSKRFSWCYWS